MWIRHQSNLNWVTNKLLYLYAYNVFVTPFAFDLDMVFMHQPYNFGWLFKAMNLCTYIP